MNSSTLILSLAILSSSFWGSWHCAAMCSPIASLVARRGALWSYHLGRGCSYMLLGALGGWFGSFFLKHEFYNVRMASGVIFSIVLIFMGYQILQGKKALAALPLPWLHGFYTQQSSGFLLGLLSIFLPCGWLYSYAFAAVATQSAVGGAILMGLFWLGTLPALSAISLFMRKSIELSNFKKQRIAGMVLLFAGLYSLLSFYFLQGPVP